MKITKTTGWSLGTTGLCVTLLAGSWFGLVEPQRAAAAESREQTVAAQGVNAALEMKIEELRAQFADLPSKQAELAAIRLALPEDAAMAELVRDVSAKTTEASTVLDSLTSSTPVAVVDPTAAAAAPAPAEAATGEPSAEPSAAPSAAPSTPAPAAAGAPVVPADGQPVLAAIPVVITVTGDYSQTTLFVKELQADMPRAFLVDSLVLGVLEAEDVEPGTVQTVITGRVFAFVDPTEIPAPPVLPDTPSDG